MTLLETVIEVTADDSWPPALVAALGFLAGLLAPWLASKGYKVAVKKPKAVTTTTTALLALVMLSGCSVFQNVNESWLKADRATYDFVAPELRRYVVADPMLTEHQRNLRLTALDSWRFRLEANEKGAE